MFKTTEDVLEGIKEYFLSELDGQLTEIEIARSCSILRWEYLDTHEINDFGRLVIEILPKSEFPQYGNEDTEPVIGDHFNNIEADVVVTATGSDPKEINQLLIRYAEAIGKLIRTDSRFGGRFNWIKKVKAFFSPMYEASGSLLKIMTYSVEVRD